MDYINLPVFNPNVFSEDEDDLPGEVEFNICSPIGLVSLWIDPTPLFPPI